MNCYSLPRPPNQVTPTDDATRLPVIAGGRDEQLRAAGKSDLGRAGPLPEEGKRPPEVLLPFSYHSPLELWRRARRFTALLSSQVIVASNRGVQQLGAAVARMVALSPASLVLLALHLAFAGHFHCA